ncbi:hypothetical protein [Hymenobacter qilianensis]
MHGAGEVGAGAVVGMGVLGRGLLAGTDPKVSRPASSAQASKRP